MKKYKNKILIFILLISIIPIPVLAECTEYCKEVAPAVRLVKIGLVPVLQIVIPIALILMAMIDLLKAVVAGREEEMKKAQSMLIKRAIYAVGLFFVMTIVHLSFNLFQITGADAEVEGTQEWWQCYSSVDECQDDEFITEEERHEMEYVCYACGNSSGRSYYWRTRGSMDATGAHGCYVTNQTETECRSHETYVPSPSPGDGDEPSSPGSGDEPSSPGSGDEPSSPGNSGTTDGPESPENAKACFYCQRSNKYKWENRNSAAVRNCTMHPEYTTEESCLESSACYFCPRNNKYRWASKTEGSMRNCTVHPEYANKDICLARNNGSLTDDDSGGVATFDNQGYGQIGTFTSTSGKTYKNYKQCYNQYGNTGKASQYGWLCNQGCGLTSAAIILSSINPSITPEFIWDDYRQYYGEPGVPVASYFTRYGMTVQSKDNEESGSTTATFTKQELITHLKSGGAAVMRFSAIPCIIDGTEWTKKNHYVAVLGYREKDDSIYISNPGDAWAKNGWYKADNLLNATTCQVRITHLAK